MSAQALTLVPGAPLVYDETLSRLPSWTGGPALPVRHQGSVDVCLEACERAEPGRILAIDDGGETSWAVIGNLITHELKNAGFTGVVVWGLHRDTAELRKIGLPLYSYGACPPPPGHYRPYGAQLFGTARFGQAVISCPLGPHVHP